MARWSEQASEGEMLEARTLVMTVCPPFAFTKSVTGPAGAFSRVFPPVTR